MTGAARKEVQDYLNQAYRLDKRIRAKHHQIGMLKDRATQATSTVTALRNSGTGAHSILEDSVSRYLDLQTDLADDIVAYHAKAKEVAGVIEKVSDNDLRVLLEYRYLCFMQWEQIAVVMHYSWRNVHYLHTKALEKVCTLLHIES